MSPGPRNPPPGSAFGPVTTMRIHAAILAAALAGHACAQWTSPPTTGAGVVYRTFWSPTAQATVSYHVSLPVAYGTDPAARFPVVYWLHGSGSPIAGIPAMASWFRNATAAGKLPPVIVVFPFGMGASMWCDSKDGAVPMESVVIDDLIPEVDASFRTIASRRGRVLEGFSMGGAGSGRLGLRRPDLFAGISLLGAGPMQLDFMDAPKGTDVPARNRSALFEAVWGSDPAYYLAEHPWTVASQRAAANVALCTKVRIGVGATDAMLAPNLDFHEHLTVLGVPHGLTVVPGVGHDPMLTLQGLGEEGWAFYRDSFATPCPQPADLDCSGAVDGADLGQLVGEWGPGHGVGDINGNGTVDGIDLGMLLSAWGPVA